MKLRLTIVVALLLSAFRIGYLNAEELSFYEKETDKWWTVFGGANAETGQATCYGRANKRDGSFIQIHRSLVDGEVWAIVHDTEWEIQGPDRGQLRWNFFNGLKNGLIAGANFDYVLKDKNTILMLQIEPKNFSEALWNARYFTLVMPGNVPNMSLSFENKGSSMLSSLVECVKQNETKYKNFKPSPEKVPDSVKEQL
ncbi:hypothetical protein QA645_00815 [Bradyrhizobium sp. CIAT3101]|uniref:hypothetical protein n=1 Tax=Bradyrhizobium sp. CIAT3101 TaxID=439387 RepID=UPI0024B18C52|nr:hypothetical protein [Bradyrhizobium sp. CIAT3101]WFU81326.1 hypothetical protein QA645_00815 [Bradyrhizobium sp. CIAT3101]